MLLLLKLDEHQKEKLKICTDKISVRLDRVMLIFKGHG